MDAEFLKYKFEDGQSGVVVKNKFKLGVRHVQIIYMVVCAMVMGALRGSTGIAVLAMTGETRRNDTYIQIFDWDRRSQGKMLSSYLLGYAMLVIPSLWIRRGGKIILSTVLLLNGGLTAAMPTMVKQGSRLVLYNAQLWLGLSQACLAPATHTLLNRWLPPSERKGFNCIIHSGITIGIMIGFPISAMISEAQLGWELVFYSQAMMTFSMAAIWIILTADSPGQHQAVGDTEKEYIKEALNLGAKKILPVPWRSIVKSKQFWAAVAAHVASNCVFVFFLMDMPAFMMIFNKGFRDVGWQCLLPFATMLVVYHSTAPTLHWVCSTLQTSYHVNVTYVRKLVNGLGATGVATSLWLLTQLTSDQHLLVLVTSSAALGSLSLQMSGFLETFRDMSPAYSGSLLTASSAAAGASAAFIPLLTGYILGDDMHDLSHWRPVFFTLIGLYVFSNLIFSALGSSQCLWGGDRAEYRSKTGYHNVMLDNVELDELHANDRKHDKMKNGDETYI